MTRTGLKIALGLVDHRAGMAELAALLHAYPAFYQCGPYRWQLGRERIDFGGLPALAPAVAPQILHPPFTLTNRMAVGMLVGPSPGPAWRRGGYVGLDV
jgi:hypothetical protein